MIKPETFALFAFGFSVLFVGCLLCISRIIDKFIRFIHHIPQVTPLEYDEENLYLPVVELREKTSIPLVM